MDPQFWPSARWLKSQAQPSYIPQTPRLGKATVHIPPAPRRSQPDAPAASPRLVRPATVPALSGSPTSRGHGKPRRRERWRRRRRRDGGGARPPAALPMPPRLPHQRRHHAEAGARQVARRRHGAPRPRLRRRALPRRGQVRRRRHLRPALLRVVPVRQGFHRVQESGQVPGIHRGPDDQRRPLRRTAGLLSGLRSIRGVARPSGTRSGTDQSSQDQVPDNHRRRQVPVAGGGGEGVRQQDSMPLAPLHRRP